MGTLLKTFGSQSSNRRSSGWGIQQDNAKLARIKQEAEALLAALA